MSIEKVGVVGCGLMGSGIAEVAARAGFDVVVREVTEPLLGQGRERIETSLAKAVEKGKLGAPERDAALGRVTFTTAVEKLSDRDLVIEAIIEDLDAKRELFQTLDGLCPEHTIFASNTSSLPITDLAMGSLPTRFANVTTSSMDPLLVAIERTTSTSSLPITDLAMGTRPDRFVGLHFFNPVPVMKLVEVVRSIATSKGSIEEVVTFAKRVGKEPITVQDNSGFVVNLLLVPYMLDAVRALERGVASMEDIDKAMVLGCGHPMGPFTLIDFVGLDTTHRICEIMYDEYREARYAPPPLLRRILALGRFGMKSGQGFYDWSGPTPVPLPLDAEA